MGWGIGNIGGGSGGGLNFKIVGNPQPANPKENMIWVNTDQKITGYYFQAEQPENMAEGELWFPTGAPSPIEFNALKRNGIQVSPVSVKQYISGTLMAKSAQIYQNGQWNDIGYYLYKDGNEYTDITGGWGAFKGYESSWTLGTFTKNADSIYIYAAPDGHDVCAAPANKIDLTDVKTLVLNVIAVTSTSEYGVDFLVSTTRNTSFNSKAVAELRDINTIGEHLLNVSGLSGSYYIGVHAYSGAENSYSMTFNSVRMIK